MPIALKRYYGKGHLHFVTFSCYERRPLLQTADSRELFVHELGKINSFADFEQFPASLLANAFLQ